MASAGPLPVTIRLSWTVEIRIGPNTSGAASRTEWEDNIPRLAGHTLPDVPQDWLSWLQWHCQLMVTLSSTKTLGFSSADLLFSRCPLTCAGTWDYSSPGSGPYACFCWTSVGFSPASSPAFQGPAEEQHSLQVYQLLPPHSVSSANLLRLHSI